MHNFYSAEEAVSALNPYTKYKRALQERSVSKKRPTSYSIANLKSIEVAPLKPKGHILANFNKSSQKEITIKKVTAVDPNFHSRVPKLELEFRN